jgi:spoIIIJ-associated protein
MSEMIKIEAPSLEEAYKKASEELGCSITDLDIKVIQHPSKGILGIGKKNAVILVKCTKEEAPAPSIKEVEEKIEKITPKNEIFDNFYKERKDLEQIAAEVERELKTLFETLCFRLDKIVVKPYDKETLLIEFGGEDAALLIGKEGYRYKALSYMLFNWLNPKYDLQIRLEIAEFLKTQEEAVRNYLAPLIERIKKEGRGQTKPLDGVLIQIALKELRAAFPDKYVGVRENRKGEKYIIVNEFRK